MSEWVDVGAADEMSDGMMRAVKAGGRELLLARVEGAFYAADERCPHMGGSLSHGELAGTVITCPRHGSRFDLRNGKVLTWTEWSGIKLALAKSLRPPHSLKTYSVQSENGRILIDIG
jgi:3-phenylpropionate/trans-cinnamate dioxygenase ferredoxin subunit